MSKTEYLAEDLHHELSPRLGDLLITVGYAEEPRRLYVHTRKESDLIPRRYKGVAVQVVVTGRVKPAATT